MQCYSCQELSRGSVRSRPDWPWSSSRNRRRPLQPDVSVEGRCGGCENDILVVDYPLHHGIVISTSIVRARFSQVLWIGNNGNSEISARCRYRRCSYMA